MIHGVVFTLLNEISTSCVHTAGGFITTLRFLLKLPALVKKEVKTYKSGKKKNRKKGIAL